MTEVSMLLLSIQTIQTNRCDPNYDITRQQTQDSRYEHSSSRDCSYMTSTENVEREKYPTSLKDLGAATGKLVNFVDHKVQSPFEVP